MLANFRTEPLRSRKYLDGSRGQPCTLEFVGVCNHNPETTVACHIHDETFGKGRKADDVSTVDGCSDCHRFLDEGWAGKISRTVLLAHVIRALQRTLRNRIDRGILVLPLDPERLSSERKVKPRKPPEQRVKIPTRDFPEGHRPLRSRNNLVRREAKGSSQ